MSMPGSSALTFIIPEQTSLTSREALTVKLLHTWYSAGHHVAVLAADTVYADYLDDLLWAREPHSFLPHQRGMGPWKSVAIITAVQDAHGVDILYNATPCPLEQLLENCAHFELVSPDEKDVLRKRFRAYRERGLSPQTQTMQL